MKIIPKKTEGLLPAVRDGDPFNRMISALSPWSGFLDTFRLRDPFSGDALPATEVTEEDDAYTVRIEVPGVDKDAVEVTLEGRMLVMKAHRITKTKDGESAYDYRRSFTLPDHVKTDDIAGSLKDGVLLLRLPKSESAKPRKITLAA